MRGAFELFSYVRKTQDPVPKGYVGSNPTPRTNLPVNYKCGLRIVFFDVLCLSLAVGRLRRLSNVPSMFTCLLWRWLRIGSVELKGLAFLSRFVYERVENSIPRANQIDQRYNDRKML